MFITLLILLLFENRSADGVMTEIQWFTFDSLCIVRQNCNALHWLQTD